MIQLLFLLNIWIYQITLELFSFLGNALLREDLVLAHAEAHLKSGCALDWDLE